MSEVTQAAVQILERLVGFDTTSRNSNLPLIEFVREHLAGLGVASILTYDDDRTKANLFATLGPPDRPGIILSAHTDVVPVDDQAWTVDPFKLTRRGDRLLGRGTVDMKGFLAVALAHAAEFLRRGLATPIHLALSYDEEVGCLGVPRLLADLAARGTRPRACIVGEPTLMQVVLGHKGKVGCRVRVRGREAHSGMPHIGANAVEAAAEAIACLKGVQRRLRDQGPHDPTFDAPPYTTIQCCLVRGGIAVNTVPRDCEFHFDIRYLPGDDPVAIVREVQAFVERSVLPEMRAVAPEAGFTWDMVPGAEPLSTGEDAPVARLVAALAQDRATRKVGFGTEAGHYQKAGIPTVVCGPGSVAQAHQPDEFVTVDQLAACRDFLMRLADHAGAAS